MRHDSAKNRLLEVQALADEQAKMQTIREVDIEDRFVDNLTSNIYVSDPERANASTEPHISVSSAEEDGTKAGSQVALQPYRSYRALSEIKELSDLLSLVDKRKSSSKSNEMLIRKSLFVGGSSPMLQAKDKMRAVRSCENVNNDRGSIELTEFATMRARQPRVLTQAAATRKKAVGAEPSQTVNMASSASDCSKSAENCGSANFLEATPHGSTYKMADEETPINTLESGNRTAKLCDNSACNTLESNKESMVSDSSTLKGAMGEDFQENDTGLRNQNLHEESLSAGILHEDVVKWLQVNGEEDAASDTSDEYRSSMCSSLNDLQSHSLPSCRSSLSSATGSTADNKQTARNSLLGKSKCFSLQNFVV